MGPLVGGAIVDGGGWRWIFYVNVPICLVALALAWHRVPGATSALTTVQTVGASVGAAVLAAILQGRLAHHHDAPASAFADTFRGVLGFTALTLIPALLLPLRRVRRRDVTDPSDDRADMAPGSRSP